MDVLVQQRQGSRRRSGDRRNDEGGGGGTTMASDLRGGATTADPEAEFLASELRTGDEWERFKENVQPLKRGRNVDLLNSALSAHRRPLLRKGLIEQRRMMIDAIDEYEGEDPLLP